MKRSCATILLTSLHASFWILPSCKAISVFSVTIPAACLLTVAQSAAGTWFSTLRTHRVSRQKTLFHCLLPTRTWYVDIDRKRNSTRLTLKNLAQAPYFGLVCTKCHQQSVITTASMSICPWQPFVTPVVDCSLVWPAGLRRIGQPEHSSRDDHRRLPSLCIL